MPTSVMTPTIHLRHFEEADRMAVAIAATQAVAANPTPFLECYAADPRSFGGRYIAADLFKETFTAYADSPATRNRYNTPVHNAAAVLSSMQVDLAIARAQPGQMALFVTGIPGAGKTTAILAAGGPAQDTAFIFEGQLSRPDTGLTKMRAALAAGLRIVILAVHRPPEDALDNTLQRFQELGRGAAIATMAEIQAGLPDGLARIRQEVPQCELVIRDYRNRQSLVDWHGWQHHSILNSEGTHDDITRRLESQLLHRWQCGGVSETGFQQAAGRPPPAHT